MKKLLTILACVMVPFCYASNDTADISCVSPSSWQETGFEVASQGKLATHYYSLAKGCDLALTEESEANFVKGYMAGIETFCTYENGYQFGVKGKDFPNACPASMAEEFNRGYRVGIRKTDLNYRTRDTAHKNGYTQVATSSYGSLSTPFSAGVR